MSQTLKLRSRDLMRLRWRLRIQRPWARLLLRAESVASSRIEGLEIGARRLLRADAARRLGIEPRDVTAREILGNIDAMTWAVDTIEQGSAITR